MSDPIDDISVPEFFITKIKTKCAGNGNLRVHAYVQRGDVLLPVFTCVISANDLKNASHVADVAAEAAFTARGAVH